MLNYSRRVKGTNYLNNYSVDLVNIHRKSQEGVKHLYFPWIGHLKCTIILIKKKMYD